VIFKEHLTWQNKKQGGWAGSRKFPVTGGDVSPLLVRLGMRPLSFSFSRISLSLLPDFPTSLLPDFSNIPGHV